jgi:hypothetical protein
MKWNRNELQGRSRRQVKNNYKVFEYSLILLILGLIISLMVILSSCKSSETVNCDAYSKIENK